MKKCLFLLMFLSASCISTASIVTDGLIIHLDASTLGLNNGDAVSTWADSAAAGADGSVSTLLGYVNPTFVAGGINGADAVQFVQDRTTITNSSIMESALWSMDASQGLTVIIAGSASTLGMPQRAVQVGANGGLNSKIIGCDLSNAENGVRYNNGFYLSRPVGAGNPLGVGELHISVRQMAQGGRHDSLLYSTGGDPLEISLGEAAANNPGNIVTFNDVGNIISLGGGELGGDGAFIDPYDGLIGEVLVYNKQLTQAQIDEVGLYLADKYSLAYVPEPATLMLLGVGTLILRRRK